MMNAKQTELLYDNHIDRKHELSKEQLQHREALERNREKTQARKKRTARLIQRGAIAEKRLALLCPGETSIEQISDQEFDALLTSLTGIGGPQSPP